MRQSYANMGTDHFVNKIYTPRQCMHLADKKKEKKREISSDFSFKKSLLDAFLLKVNSQEKSANETKKIIREHTVLHLDHKSHFVCQCHLSMTCKFGELKTFVQFAPLHVHTRTRTHTHTRFLLA